MKLLMENFGKFLEEEKIDEMNPVPPPDPQDYRHHALRSIIMKYSPNPDDPRLINTNPLAHASAPDFYQRDNPDNPNAKQEMQDYLANYEELVKSASPEKLENMLQSLFQTDYYRSRAKRG